MVEVVSSKSLVSATEVLLISPQLQASHPHTTEFKDRKGNSLGRHCPHGSLVLVGVGGGRGVVPRRPPLISPYIPLVRKDPCCPWTRSCAHLAEIKESLSCP